MGAVSSDPDTLETPIASTVIEDSQESLGVDDEYVRGEGVPLSKPSKRGYLSDNVSVDFEGVGYQSNAVHD